ncbi:MAG: dynamin family protein [Selenomonadaceae bacterium]|nr:dynamin family protein [Selenomonadaceae bacterium]
MGRSLKDFFSEVLGKIERETKLGAIQGFSEGLESFKQRINDDFFRLAVIGEFSSGKSTFINALIGRDILSHATKETTAVLTRIINVAEDDPRKGSAVAFMKSGERLSIRNFDELKDYTTAVSTKYRVAQDINVVEIYMPLLHVTRPLMIMDTPGLNGIAEGHLEQTKEIVKKAHACIYLIQQRGLTKDDLEFLRENLVPYQQRFIFVQNFIDEFNSMEEERLDDRIDSLRKTLSEKVFGESSGHVFYICGVSALQELVSRDKTIKRLYATDTRDLTDEDRRRLASTSNFESFRSILEEKFSEQRLDDIQYRDTAVAVLYWTRGLLQKISRRLVEDEEVYKTSRERNAAERIERLIKRIRDRRQDNLMAIRGFISGEIRKLNKELDRIIEDAVAETEQRLNREINDCSKPEEVDHLRDVLKQKIPREYQRIGGNAIDYCKISFQGLYQLVMERVEEYSGIRSVQSGEGFQLGVLPTQQRQFQSENDLERTRAERAAIQSKLSGERETLQRANSNVRSQESTVNGLTYDVNSTQQRISQKQNEIRRMGSRPEEKVWYEDVAVERGGFFGSIMDIFSTKYESQERRDDSAGEAWDKERRRLQTQQNSLSQQLDDTRRKKQAAQSILDRYRQNAKDSAERVRQMEERLNRLAEQERLDRIRLEKEKTLAKENYVRMCKNQLREEVTKYFRGDDGASKQLSDELRRGTAEGEQKLASEAEREFNRSVERKLAELEQARQGNMSVLQKKIAGMEQTRQNLERYAGEMEEQLA